MNDQQWSCIIKGEPAAAIRVLYPGVAQTSDGLLWKSADGRRVYLAKLTCDYTDDNGNCIDQGRTIKDKKVYTR